MSKLYKGILHSVLPRKNYGFIVPVWGEGKSNNNIFFHLSETKGKACYILALASKEEREELVSDKGTKTFIPKNPQTLYFELEASEVNGTVKLAAKRIRDENHVSEAEKAEAELNTEKPDARSLLHISEATVDVSVTPETIQAEEEPKKEDACTTSQPVAMALYTEEELAALKAEEEAEEEYEDSDIDYDEYDEYDEYYDENN